MAQAPLSLYFDLQEGQKPDLTQVSKAAISWAAAIEEIVFILDPSMEVRIEYDSTTEGSLSLNTIIRTAREKVTDPRTIMTAVTTAAMWFILEVGGWGVGEIMDWMSGPDAPVEIQSLSEEDKREIADEVVKRLRGVGETQIQDVFIHAQKDTAITGVGVTSAAGKRPQHIVQRSSFSVRAGHFEITSETVTKRFPTKEMRVVLVSPVLVPEAPNRRWKFATTTGEFGASIKDMQFLEDVWSGRTSIKMEAGIEMDIELETTEEFQAGVWIPKRYTVNEVKRLYPPSLDRQGQLPLSQDSQDDNSDEDDGGGSQ